MHRVKRETELTSSLSIYVIFECPIAVCNFLFSEVYSHALQVKPVYITAGPAIFLLPLMGL
ncbi:hypothetical protein EXN66_Car021327 [Channa argus]|uniref:Uncharacterized protein n=1 Tax=Channa argus TaxID=215402 RepID=A0A6G1QU78_CHAAH|nr:hypothetical protein EXN66_Car021327 [Channa argus]